MNSSTLVIRVMILTAPLAACSTTHNAGERAPASVSPGASAVLFGGEDENGNPLGDTWTWDSSTLLWTEQGPHGGPTPDARFGASAVPYSFNKSVLIFGGLSNLGPLNDPWLWDGTAWSQERLVEIDPKPDYFRAMAMLNGNIILTGSSGTDTRTYSNFRWTPIEGPTPARYGAATATLGGTVVLFGGRTFGGPVHGDTWTFDGTSWTQHSNLTPSPAARVGAMMAALNGTVLLFGGEDPTSHTLFGDTWTWDGTSWTEQHPAVSPGVLTDAAMAAVGNGILLFGGTITIQERGVPPRGDFGFMWQTWFWDGANWSQASNNTRLNPGPSRRADAVLAALPQ
jgi:hypothetical protein